MSKKARKPVEAKVKTRCGIVMPISATAECSAAHWEDVLAIIQEALDQRFSAELVSVADETRVIQSRIIQSLYDDKIVVCDVSCRNPNVMFELGIRLAFDKPTVVIKDESTEFSFDSAPLEHLIYPRSLSYKEICDFRRRLADKVQATLERSQKPNYQSFLKTFAPYVVAGRLDAKEVSEGQFLNEKLDQILSEVYRLRAAQRPRSKSGFPAESLFGQAEAQSASERASTEFKVGQRVRVKSGALAGMEGSVVGKREGGRLTVGVKFLNQRVTVLVEDSDVERLL